MNNKYIFITLLMLSTIFSQEKNHNLNFLLANNAYGLSYEYQRFVKPDLSVGADLRFYDIRTDEYPVYDPFYNQYDVSGEKSILILPMYLRFNYYPFKDKIANNFQPFLLLSFGCILIRIIEFLSHFIISLPSPLGIDGIIDFANGLWSVIKANGTAGSLQTATS